MTKCKALIQQIMEIMAQPLYEGNIIIKNTFVRKIINGDALKYE